MKFAKIFFGVSFVFGMVFVFSGVVSAQVSSCTHSGRTGTCVLGSGDCANGSVYGGTECAGNNERTLCCIGGGSGGGQEGMACTSPGGQSGTCHDVGRCPAGQLVGTASSTCSNAGFDYCCVANSEGGGGGGGGGGQCSALNSYCKSNCTNFGGANSACSGACEGSTATRGLTYCSRSTSGGGGGGGGGGGDGAVDTSTGWTGGLSALKTESGLPNKSVREITEGVLLWILAILGFIAIIAFIVAGILYLTAAGNDGQIKTAKAAMTWSIVGVIVALMGYVIIKAADFFLRGSV